MVPTFFPSTTFFKRACFSRITHCVKLRGGFLQRFIFQFCLALFNSFCSMVVCPAWQIYGTVVKLNLPFNDLCLSEVHGASRILLLNMSSHSFRSMCHWKAASTLRCFITYWFDCVRSCTRIGARQCKRVWALGWAYAYKDSLFYRRIRPCKASVAMWMDAFLCSTQASPAAWILHLSTQIVDS